MKTICIRPVPFCYGPTAIAIAVARQFRAIKGVRLVAIGDAPSLDLLESEDGIFDAVIRGKDASSCVRSAQAESATLYISVCDFEFAEAVRREAPSQHLVFVDPLLWMWHEPPEALGKCDLYCALDFPGVRELAREYGLDDRHFAVVPQVAEWRGKRVPKSDSIRRVLVNLGGMQSAFGCNMPLAEAMCEEIAHAAAASTTCRVRVCTGNAIAEELRESSMHWPPIEIASLDKAAFDDALGACDCLLTVPGMSIVFESCLAKTPTFFLLPLNYSQHLQLAHYREMFENVPGVFLEDLGEYDELKPGMPEANGVAAAAAIGSKFAGDIEARARFRSAIRSHLSSLTEFRIIQ
ncbi:MAG: hypothetical protein NTZ17_00935 [Phycisphaerae bacterium]|nr:hypothetical protein [Phycisphaerae bacterium]